MFGDYMSLLRAALQQRPTGPVMTGGLRGWWVLVVGLVGAGRLVIDLVGAGWVVERWVGAASCTLPPLCCCLLVDACCQPSEEHEAPAGQHPHAFAFAPTPSRCTLPLHSPSHAAGNGAPYQSGRVAYAFNLQVGGREGWVAGTLSGSSAADGDSIAWKVLLLWAAVRYGCGQRWNSLHASQPASQLGRLLPAKPAAALSRRSHCRALEGQTTLGRSRKQDSEWFLQSVSNLE